LNRPTEYRQQWQKSVHCCSGVICWRSWWLPQFTLLKLLVSRRCRHISSKHIDIRPEDPDAEYEGRYTVRLIFINLPAGPSVIVRTTVFLTYIILLRNGEVRLSVTNMLKFIRGKGQQPSVERQKIQKDLFAFRRVTMAPCTMCYFIFHSPFTA